MSRKKMMPLLILTAGVLLLSILLVILTLAQSQNENQGIALFGVSTEEIDQLSYSGSNVEVTLLKGTEGNWLMESDPTLPLDQEIVASLPTLRHSASFRKKNWRKFRLRVKHR